MPIPIHQNGTSRQAAASQGVVRQSELRSQPVREILSRRPDFFTRWALMVIAMTLLSLILLASAISYPNLVQAPARLTSINAPKPILTFTSGKLVRLFAGEGQKVAPGEVLGYIEAIGDHAEVLRLSRNIDASQALMDAMGNDDRFAQLSSARYLRLGELQSSYQVFADALRTFRNYRANGFYLREKAMLQQDAAKLAQLSLTLQQQKSLMEQDVALTQQNITANDSLKKDKIISDFDYRAEMSRFIGKKLTLPQVNAAILNNDLQLLTKQKELAELENTIGEQKAVFLQALNTFRSAVDDWKKKYVLTAPIAGTVAFAAFIQENQQLQAYQTICYINPGNSEYFAEVLIPQSNFGKVAIGQQVLLKFPSYPFQEYGNVKGRIEFISHIPSDSGYNARVTFGDGLHTSYKKEIQYRDGLVANAEIITENMSLLKRFCYDILKVARPHS
jgi:multidrug efflux pump subunit AcrA (membrane-fusion protein)